MNNSPFLKEVVITLDKNALEVITQRLRIMRLPEMANQIMMMWESGELNTISTIDLLERMTSEEMMSRTNNKIKRILKAANMSQPFSNLADFEITPERKINEAVLKQISDDEYIIKKRNVIILGSCGTGKSYLANALIANACEHLHTALYCRMFEIFMDMNEARNFGDGNIKNVMNKYTKPEVLVIDDFMLDEITNTESMDLFKILEYRNANTSTIIVSQLEPKEWHSRMKNGVLADAVLDRITGGAYKITISGDSHRQKK